METGDALETARLLLGRAGSTLADKPEGFPVYADPDTGAWSVAEDGFWTGGFWMGHLWVLCARNQLPVTEVMRWLQRLAPRVDADTSLRGLLFWYGAGLGHRLCASAQARELGVAGARALVASQHHPSGVIPLGNAFGESPDAAVVEVNIDGLAGTAALCGWAADETSDERLRAAAIIDARAHADLLVRPDGSTWQAASLERDTGCLRQRHTQKGLRDDSTWARGQAWAMLGFTQAAHWLSPEFVQPAVATADWWCTATPAHRVPPWDFDDRDGLPDTSAAAIAARALLSLAEVPDVNADAYRNAAHETLEVLVTNHVTSATRGVARPAGMLLDGCYNQRAHMADHHQLIWGDWFLLEALLAVSGFWHQPWAP